MNALQKFAKSLCSFSATLLLASSAAIVSAQSDQETLKLVPSDGAADDYFGIRVAISGETAIVGAYRDSDQTHEAGAAYLYNVRTGSEFMQLYASDYSYNDRFGAGVAINESYAIVGAIYDDDNGSQSGSAYVFNTATGVELRKLLPLDGSADENFGSRLAISGTTVVGGLSSDDDNGLLSGSAYLFDASTGFQLAKQLPSDGGANQDYFGVSVAIDGDLVVVGLHRRRGSSDGSRSRSFLGVLGFLALILGLGLGLGLGVGGARLLLGACSGRRRREYILLRSPPSSRCARSHFPNLPLPKSTHPCPSLFLSLLGVSVRTQPFPKSTHTSAHQPCYHSCRSFFAVRQSP